MESPWDWGTKVWSNGPGDMTKMAAMSIYDKNLKTSSSPESKGRWPWTLVCSIGCSNTTKFFSNDDLELTLTYLTARSNLVPYAFVWEKGKTMDFLQTIVVYDLKLATDYRSDRKFLLTSILCPLGGREAISPLSRGYIHVLNHEKIV